MPIFSKVIEQCMKMQLSRYFEHNNVLNMSQYGFRTGLSTIKAVESVVSEIIRGFESRSYTCVTLVDLSKAFDSVSHDILASKLQFYGIQSNELNLIKSYLTNRHQIVKIMNVKSEELIIQTGVPQGSVLGPFLFVVYMNDLPSCLPHKSVLYADDTTFITNAENTKSLQEKNEEMIIASSSWFLHNELTLNAAKTVALYFNLNHENANDSNIESVKLLGIYMDAKLNWNRHTDEMCKKLARVLYLLRKLKTSVGEDLLISAYYAFFHPHLLYGNLFWGNSKGALNVFKWQKKAVRCIKGVSDRVSCKKLYSEYKIMTVPSIFVYQSLMYVKENYAQITRRTDIHDYNTRQKDNMDTPYVRLSKTQHSYRYCGVKYFNLLPSFIRDMNQKRFDSYIKNMLKNSCLYSVGEFETYLRDHY